MLKIGKVMKIMMHNDIQTVFVLAARYSHNRETGAAFIVVRSLKKHWNQFNELTRDQIIKESHEATTNQDDWEELRNFADDEIVDDKIDVYVDGSYKPKDNKARWAYIIVQNNKKIHSDSGIIDDEETNKGRQVGGECQAVVEAVKYLQLKGLKAKIYYDYIGVKSWVADIFDEKTWTAKKKYTQEYREFILENRDCIVDMIKVKAHTGNYWNEHVDKIAGSI